MAVVNLVIPFVILYRVIDSGFFSFGAKFVFAFVLTWLVIFFACRTDADVRCTYEQHKRDSNLHKKVII